MSEINRLITKVKCISSVDDFTSNLEKAFEEMVSGIVEDVRTYKTPNRTHPIMDSTPIGKEIMESSKSVVNWCSFHQESIAKELEEKYLKG